MGELGTDDLHPHVLRREREPHPVLRSHRRRLHAQFGQDRHGLRGLVEAPAFVTVLRPAFGGPSSLNDCVTVVNCLPSPPSVFSLNLYGITQSQVPSVHGEAKPWKLAVSIAESLLSLPIPRNVSPESCQSDAALLARKYPVMLLAGPETSLMVTFPKFTLRGP